MFGYLDAGLAIFEGLNIMAAGGHLEFWKDATILN